MMRRFPLFLFVTVLALSACNTGKDIPEELPFERYDDSYSMHSDILGTDVFFSVYLPEDYNTDTERSYPVVYMLHGLGDNWKSWNGNYLHANQRISSLEGNGKISPMIYVFPCGFRTYYCNYYSGKYNYMDMFAEEFVPFIDSKFRTIADRDHRATVGYSMGGFGAVALAEQHPELFSNSASLSMSFRTDEQYMAESQGGWDNQWGTIFGGIDKSGYERITDYYKAHCPLYVFSKQNEKLKTVNWFLTCGDDEEQLLIANDTLHTVMRNNGYEHEFRVGNGAHTGSYWMDALSEVLPWLDSKMNSGNAWPECSNVLYQSESVEFEDDMAALSSAYGKERSDAKGVYFLHHSMSTEDIKTAMSVLYSTNTKVKFALLPCDLDKKDVHKWVKEWEEVYPQCGHYAVAFGDAGADACRYDSLFGTIILVQFNITADYAADKEKTYLFACTDLCDYHADAGALYRSCKATGADFEYRVINGSADGKDDIFACLYKLKSYINY